jgi:ATP-dependent RNA helicase DDX35
LRKQGSLHDRSETKRVILAMADFDLATSFIPSLYKPASLLPIAKHRESLLYTIETHAVTIVVGQTGCGKSTQLPQFLEKAGWCSEGKAIAITQVSFLSLKLRHWS